MNLKEAKFCNGLYVKMSLKGLDGFRCVIEQLKIKDMHLCQETSGLDGIFFRISKLPLFRQLIIKYMMWLTV